MPDQKASGKPDIAGNVFNRNAGNKSQEWLSKLKGIKERLMKAMKNELEENLYKNKKTGTIQSFDPVRDQEEMKDPQFNQIFTKA